MSAWVFALPKEMIPILYPAGWRGVQLSKACGWFLDGHIVEFLLLGPECTRASLHNLRSVISDDLYSLVASKVAHL